MRKMLYEPLVMCLYGWGQIFRLYQDRIEVNGIVYALNDLVHVRSIYRNVLGIDSARIELCFRERDVVLRGIAAIEDARKAVEYLATHCIGGSTVSEHGVSGPKARGRGMSRYGVSNCKVPNRRVPTYSDISLEEHAQALTAPVETPHWGHTQERAQQEQRVRAEELLPIQVPLHLPPGECAYYKTDATLCREPLSESSSDTCPVQDHGMLILTNKRMIYLGRKSQIVLDYARLLHTSHLHGAIAFLATNWSTQQLFQVRRPVECTMYVECILQRFQEQQLESSRLSVT